MWLTFSLLFFAVWHDNKGLGGDWWLDRIEVETNESPPRTWVFPCAEWLNKSKGLSRDLPVFETPEAAAAKAEAAAAKAEAKAAATKAEAAAKAKARPDSGLTSTTHSSAAMSKMSFASTTSDAQGGASPIPSVAKSKADAAAAADPAAAPVAAAPTTPASRPKSSEYVPLLRSPLFFFRGS